MKQTQITIELLNEKINDLNKKFEKLKEDLEFSRRIRNAWEEYDRGEFKEMSFDGFIEEIKKW